MRIQHNIMAMNSYRNYNTNISSLSGNLEKLSSGYRINRAGDDAAGLAISEKMRAQITGLDAAQKNVKDGISLVKTAEGAMQEIQDMMNRMKYLAVQSANGTYDNEVDRANLQKEVEALKTEINRIADSANFNGQKLLNGELSADGSASAATAFDDINGALAAAVQDVDSVNALSTVTAATMADTLKVDAGTTINVNFAMSDGSSYEFKMKLETNADGEFDIKDADGNILGTVADADSLNATAVADAIVTAMNNSDLSKAYEAANSSDAVTLTHLAGGSEGANITSFSISGFKADGTTSIFKTAPVLDTADGSQVKGEDATKSLNLSGASLYGGEVDGDVELEDAAFEINGEKFVFYDDTGLTNEQKAEALAAMEKAGVSFVKTTAANATAIGKMANLISKETGLDVVQGTNDGNGAWTDDSAAGVSIKVASTISGAAGKGGMTLQIGDTADSYNQLSVTIDDMHVDALGIGSLDIGNIKGAQKAVDAITDAINKVSSTRGDLGAIQNRLEHTANNLSVMEENIQDAESTIRDTDVADEMMAYTKNNILIQSAQAMLAQANQVPQGVLQLLQ